MQKTPPRSLKNVLTVWFLLFSVVPLGFLTGYSIIKYREGVEHELKQRVHSNLREFANLTESARVTFKERSDKLARNRSLIYFLSSSNVAEAERLVAQWMRTFSGSKISLIRDDGVFLFSMEQSAEEELVSYRKLGEDTYTLKAAMLERLKQNKDDLYLVVRTRGDIHLIHNQRVYREQNASEGRAPVGFVEQVLVLTGDYLEGLRRRIGAEIFILDSEKKLTASSHGPLLLYKGQPVPWVTEFTSSKLKTVSLEGQPYSFAVEKVFWGEDHFYVGIGVSRSYIESVTREITVAFVTVAVALILLLVLMVFVIARSILKPLNQLVEASQKIHETDAAVEVEVTTDTEIGLLTESFNQMSRKIASARLERQEKIKELETANKNYRQAQAQLVQSAKMASLGQLVAGIAHELNNPIGFISSNMSFLRDYVEKLDRVVAAAASRAADVEKVKKEVDYDYVKEDLFKLIRSCEEGAKRTKKIVLGLRSFSHFNEENPAETDLREGLENTLMLLQGELRDRITVEKNYDPAFPKVVGFAGAINQVFMNVLQNAIQAIEGTGRISIETRALGDRVRVSIRDTGKGMPPEVLEKIFDPFFTTKDVGEGTGLGMSISYGIIKKHGGSIQVESQPGAGSVFHIELPVGGAGV